MRVNIIIIEIIIPIEDNIFILLRLFVNVEYRRGIPIIPILCCGKNVMLDLKIIVINCDFIILLFMLVFVVIDFQNSIMLIIE
jgi:hypothetical protein